MRDLTLSLDESLDPSEPLARAISKQLDVPRSDIQDVTVVRRALDARRGRVRYVFEASFEVDIELLSDSQRGKLVIPDPKPVEVLTLSRVPDGPPPIIVGAGPAGLFAALTLARAGWPAIVIDRGKPVESRGRDVSALYARGVLNPNSNVCYGEGGAGTYSDGKLYTRVNDARTTAILEWLVQFGARGDILINTRPHIGTDRLVKVLVQLRKWLVDHGTQFMFEEEVTKLVTKQDSISSLTMRSGEHLDTSEVVMATGHSARAVWPILQQAGAALEAKPFAVGFRVEHPQAFVNEMRYGKVAGYQALPAADYRLTYNQSSGDRRGVYSFCMCPGGVVVTTPTEPEALCINGMSHASRSGRFANSAMVVTLGPEDLAPWSDDPLWAGVRFQESVEQEAFTMGGGMFRAPSMRVADYVGGGKARDAGPTSYRRGLNPSADLSRLYPSFVSNALHEGLTHFEKKMRGFTSNEAQLIGVETRTSAPVRVLRHKDRCESEEVAGLYPCGEGMGYGGGIVSAALDGIRCAEAMLRKHGA